MPASLTNKIMITTKQLKKIKTQYAHAFTIEENGNMTLKEHFGIPKFKMIFVEGGEFIMGDGSYDNNPKHKVEISSFYMAEFQLTQEIYKAVALSDNSSIKIKNENPSNFEGINHPVEEVSWEDAIKFCKKLNEILKLPKICDNNYNLLNKNGQKTENTTEVKGFRLPTEAEWEFAAKGGSVETRRGVSQLDAMSQLDPMPLKYAGSNNLDDVGWYDKNNEYETKPVGLKFPNQLEIYDMSGNVWEWCWDWYDDDFYKKTAEKNPINLNKSSLRVLRGGSWYFIANRSRVAYRGNYAPDRRYNNIGFRLFLSLQFTV